MLFPIIADGLVEGSILVLGDVVGFAHPEWLHVVEVFPFVGDFLDFLGLLFFLGFLFVVNFFDFGFVVVTLIFVVVIVVCMIGGDEKGERTVSKMNALITRTETTQQNQHNSPVTSFSVVFSV